jgi:hypothetical protein
MFSSRRRGFGLDAKILVVAVVVVALLAFMTRRSVAPATPREAFVRDGKTLLALLERLNDAHRHNVSVDEYRKLCNESYRAVPAFCEKWRSETEFSTDMCALSFLQFELMGADGTLKEEQIEGCGIVDAVHKLRYHTGYEIALALAPTMVDFCEQSLNGGVPDAPHDLSSPQGRIQGHWMAPTMELWFGPANSAGYGVMAWRRPGQCTEHAYPYRLVSVEGEPTKVEINEYQAITDGATTVHGDLSLDGRHLSLPIGTGGTRHSDFEYVDGRLF